MPEVIGTLYFSHKSRSRNPHDFPIHLTKDCLPLRNAPPENIREYDGPAVDVERICRSCMLGHANASTPKEPRNGYSDREMTTGHTHCGKCGGIVEVSCICEDFDRIHDVPRDQEAVPNA